MKISVILSAILLVTSELYGQNNISRNNLSLSWGLSNLSRQDLIFSPFIHSDLSTAVLKIEYSRDSRFFQRVTIGYTGFNPMVSEPYEFKLHDEPQTAYPHTFTFLDIQYLIGKPLLQTKYLNILSGILLNADIQLLNYVYGRIESFGYYSAIGPGIFGRINLSTQSAGSFSLDLKIPVMTWLARSPYLVNDDEFIENISSHSNAKTFFSVLEDGRFVTWNRLQTFEIEAEYVYYLTQWLGLGAGFRFSFIHTADPRNMISFQNSALIKVHLKF